MKSLKYILFTSAVMLFVACFSDKSTDAVLPISEITIESGIDSVYDIDKNSTLVIKPIVKQSIDGKHLGYTWEVNMHAVSHETEFTFVGDELGKFNCRLIVENEDGKAFLPFVINVNSPYEYGITVLSEDKDGKSMLSFMQDPMKEGDVAKFTEGDCFEINNKDMDFASHPTDIVQSSGSLIVACQGSDKAGDDAIVYFLNDKTFVVENYVTSKEYPTFKPTKLMVPPQSAAGISYPVLSADGKVYDMPTYDAILQPSTKFFSTYSQSCFLVSEKTNYVDILFWDKEKNGMALLYNHYGPYYFGSKYLMLRDDEDYEEANYFKNVQRFIKMTYVHRTKEQISKSDREMLVIVESDDIIQKLIVATFPWDKKEAVEEYYMLDNGGFKLAGTKSPLDENTPCIANKTYLSLLFADGNKVRRWYYTKTTHINKADVLQTVGGDNAIITDFYITDDHKKTYVAFYDPTKEGLNGSVWVIDTDNGTVLEKYDNVCYKPVKMIYKTR